jgi:hypothetical protein
MNTVQILALAAPVIIAGGMYLYSEWLIRH